MEEEKKEEIIEEKDELTKTKESLAELQKANSELLEAVEEKKTLEQKLALGGKSEAGQIPAEPVPETDEELTERFQRGELDLAA